MKTFSYSFIAQFVYRYGNIPVTIVLLFYLVISAITITESWFGIVSVIVHIILLFVINRFYYRGYKYYPYLIKADNTKMVCSNFFMSRKKITIKLDEIVDIRGGIFSNSPTRPIYITDKQGQKIGINQHLKGFNELNTLLLSNIEKGLYDELLGRMRKFGEKRKNRKK